MSEEIAIPEKHHEILAANHQGLLSTLRHKDWLISTNPVSYVFDGTRIRVSTIKNRIKYDNLRANPMVTLCVVHAEDPTRYVEVRGTATLEDDPEGVFLRHQFRETSGGAEAPDDLDVAGTERVIITIHPIQSSSPLLYGGRFGR